MTTVAYYPGCSIHGTSSELGASFTATAKALGLELQEIPDWICCGNTAAHSINRLASIALPVSELAKIEHDMHLDAVAIPCAACYSRFKAGAHEVQDPAMASDVIAVVGRGYGGSVAVHNLIDVYHTVVGLEALKARVTHPLKGLKVACYYGCLLTRPPEVTHADNPEYPVHMDEVVAALGCEPVDWNYKTDCCGASLSLTEQGIADDLVTRIVTDARNCGAEALVMACPLCQTNLDGRQTEIARKASSWQALPSIFLSQLVGHAIGLPNSALGLGKHFIDVKRVMS